MKKFENPMLQIVSISKNDIIATSDFGSGQKAGNEACAPERNMFNTWYEGY